VTPWGTRRGGENFGSGRLGSGAQSVRASATSTKTGAHGERGLAGEIGDGEHFVAERWDEEQVDFGKNAGHFFGDSAAQAIGLNEIHGGQETRLAEEVWPGVVGLDLELVGFAA